MAVEWRISQITENDSSLIIKGYRDRIGGQALLLDSKITKMTLDEFLEKNVECHEGQSLVMIRPKECYLIEVDLSDVESPNFVESILARYGNDHSFGKLIADQRSL